MSALTLGVLFQGLLAVEALATSSTSTLTVDGWTSLGCYTDNVSGRALSYGLAVPGGPTALTIEICLSGCKALGYIYAGVEYSDECCVLSPV